MRKAFTFRTLKLCLLLVLLPCLIRAQLPKKPGNKEKDRVSVQNEPENAANLHFIISPFYCDFYGANINAGYRGEISLNYRNKFMIDAKCKRSYVDFTPKYDLTDYHNSANGQAAAGYQPFTDAGISGTWYFYQDMDDEDAVVKFRSNGHIDGEEAITSNILVLYGARLGLGYLETAIDQNAVSYQGYFKNDPSKRMISQMGGLYSDMLHENIISAGVSCTRIHDLVVSAGGSEAKRKFQTSYYADFLFAPAMVYDNIYFRNVSFLPGNEGELVVNDNTPKNRFGFSLGADFNMNTAAGVHYFGEMGVRPGATFINGIFLTIGIDFCLNTHVFQN